MDPRDPAERLGLLSAHFSDLADFWLRAAGRWSAKGKAILRVLAAADASFAERYQRAFNTAFGGDVSEVVALTEAILASHGGRYWSGDIRYAPKDEIFAQR